MRCRQLAIMALCGLALSWPGLEIGALGGTGLAHADDEPRTADDRLARGRTLFQDQEYKRAVRVLAPILKERAVTRTQRVQALELIGLSHIILNQERRAEEAFWALLEIDPRHELAEDFGSEKIREVFDRVKAGYFPAVLEHEPPREAQAGTRVDIGVRATRGAELVKDVIVLARRRGDAEYQRVALSPRAGGAWRGKLDLPASGDAYVLEYHAEGLDIGGRLVASLGAARKPLDLPVEAGGVQREQPWYRRWYVIAGGAALVGVGVIVLVSASD